MEAIQEKHQGLISGPTKLYGLLVTMRYFSPSDIVYPPYNATTPSIDVEKLQRLGFSEEVIQLTKLLPAPRHSATWGHYPEYRTDIGPRSWIVNYFKHNNEPEPTAGEERIEYLMDGLRDTLGSAYDEMGHRVVKLPSWSLRIADGEFHGLHLIYDTELQALVEGMSNIPGREYWYPDRPWTACPPRSAVVVLEEMYQKLESLEWVPWYTDNYDWAFPRRHIIENPANYTGITHQTRDHPALSKDPDLALRQLEALGDEMASWFKIEHYRWRGKTRLFELCGWGSDAGFDGEEFEMRRTLLEQQYLRDVTDWTREDESLRPNSPIDYLSKEFEKELRELNEATVLREYEFWEKWAMENGVLLQPGNMGDTVFLPANRSGQR